MVEGPMHSSTLSTGGHQRGRSILYSRRVPRWEHVESRADRRLTRPEMIRRITHEYLGTLIISFLRSNEVLTTNLTRQKILDLQ